MTDPASIRYNNPGAMWDGKVSQKWGSTKAVVLADGQANHIAIFPTKVQGACAQFDLWKTSYLNMTLLAAITKWSGGNSSPNYMQFLTKKAGVTSGTIINTALLSGPTGLALMKAQAQWEAGKVFPMLDAEWAEAQKKVFSSVVSKAPVGTGTVLTTATGGATVAAATHFETARTFVENHWLGVLFGVIAIGLVIDLAIALYKNGKKNVGVN